MSDVSQGSGWWIASDGKWYPPEQHPSVQQPPFEARWKREDLDPSVHTPAIPWHKAQTIRSASQQGPSTGQPTTSHASDTMIIDGSRRVRRFANWKFLAGIGGLVVLVVTGSLVLVGSTASPTRPSTGHPMSPAGGLRSSAPTSTTPPATTSPVMTQDWLASHASPTQAVAMAKAIASSEWTTRNAALVASDPQTLAMIETGVALHVDLFQLAMVQCGCQAAFTTTPATGLQVIVPEQATYPLYFLAAYQTAQLQAPEIMIYTKVSAQAGWLVAFDTENDDAKIAMSLPQAPSLAGQPAGIEPALPGSTGADSMQQMVAYISAAAVNNGDPPQNTAFGGSMGAQDLASQYSSPAAGTATLPEPFSYSNVASSTPSDGMWSFSVTGLETGASAMTCGTIRDTTTNTATTSAPIVQNGQFGPFLAPGKYTSIIQVGGMETCVVTLANGALDDLGDNVGGISYSGTPAS